MYPLFKSIETIYEKLFLLKPKILSTILFIPLLYLLGWIMAQPIVLIGLGTEKISLVGTIFTFIIFVFSLQKWFKVRWGEKKTWRLLGVNNIYGIKKIIVYFLKGFFYSLVLLSLILWPLIIFGWANWQGTVSNEILLNAILLILGVGFAEELIFRGWLLEDLRNQFGLKKAIIYQSLIFSIVHIGFNFPFWDMLSILLGLFLLGFLLSIRRLKDRNSIWGCVGLHGGLVGIWFVFNNGFVEISKNAPIWLVGPGGVNSNPLGGLYGIFLLSFVCLLILFKKIIKFEN